MSEEIENLKPVWLLDIDSTIQVPPPHSFDIGNNRKKLHKVWAEWEHIMIGKFHITYAPKVIDFIKRMDASGLVDIQWLTTWKHEANTTFAPAVGLPQFEVADGGGSDFIYPHENWWKYRTAEQAASVRPTIWSDDDITKKAAENIVKWGQRNDQDVLVLRPEDARALEPFHLEQIEAFIMSHQEY